VSDFEEQVRAALDELPPKLARALKNLAVVVEEENPADPDLFGLFQGVPLTEESSVSLPGPPNKISIYRRPLEEAFPHPPDLREEIRITVLHELAHYFGIEEGRLTELGYE
jgi:predicted Zn-dependent protease with MMP-like domain